MNKNLSVPLILWLFCATVFGQVTQQTEFISYGEAQPIIGGMRDSLPPELEALGAIDAAKWNTWVQERDREIRQRLERGEEDTLVNLLRFGVTYTKEYRIEDEYLVRYGNSSLVDSFAQNRANDLVSALAAPNPSPGIADMRDFLVKKGFAFKTPQERAKVRQYLLDNLGRMRDEFLKYRAQKKDESRFQLFQDRGISLDTNLWPDYQLDVAFRELAAKGLVKPGGIRRVAIVGPGLDFVNKEAGVDFYPPQTTQPFAVLDSLIRLGLADTANIELYTLDISQSVNVHVAGMRKHATRGQAYTVQLPWNTQRPMSDEYRAAFVAYWQKLGDKVGDPVAAIPVPLADAGTQNRAIRIRPQIVLKITPIDMNVVYQRLDMEPEQAFDLVIGTNIFVYYGKFEQALARANVAGMLRPGGFLLSNDKLPDTVAVGLKDVLDANIVSSNNPLITDTMFCYQRVR
ncbi:MAG: class I SAM-dependent methyltransferase [Candidatus Korobacteraceae bacterium]